MGVYDAVSVPNIRPHNEFEPAGTAFPILPLLTPFSAIFRIVVDLKIPSSSPAHPFSFVLSPVQLKPPLRGGEQILSLLFLPGASSPANKNEVCYYVPGFDLVEHV